MDVATLPAAAFAALAETRAPLLIYSAPEDPAPVVEAIVDKVLENPRGTMPESPRTAFSAFLHFPPHIVQYCADVWVSAEGWSARIGPLHIARVGQPSPADSQRTLYELICN